MVEEGGSYRGEAGARVIFHFVTSGEFKILRRRRQRERQKSNKLNRQTTTLHVHHALLYISLPSVHDYDGKMPNFTFYGGPKQATAKFSFSF